MFLHTLTAALQDYLEAIYRLEQRDLRVRISDIAAELGTKLPTVTRTVRRLTSLGLVAHKDREGVALTAAGARMAHDILHLHEDVVHFLTGVLGLPRELAEIDACQIEHGVSAATAERLHDFLEHFASLDQKSQILLTGRTPQSGRRKKQFGNLSKARVGGWRT
jgi:DtxR family Mn-dependent transcriptional regulator